MQILPDIQVIIYANLRPQLILLIYNENSFVIYRSIYFFLIIEYNQIEQNDRNFYFLLYV